MVENKRDLLKTGTTIVGFRYKDGIIIGADTQSSSGCFPYVKVQPCEKISLFKLDSNGEPSIVIGGAGYAYASHVLNNKIFQELLSRYERCEGLLLENLKTPEAILTFFEEFTEFFWSSGQFRELHYPQALFDSGFLMAVRTKYCETIIGSMGFFPEFQTELTGGTLGLAKLPFTEDYKSPIFTIGSGSIFAGTALKQIDRVKNLNSQNLSEAKQSIKSALRASCSADYASQVNLIDKTIRISTISSEGVKLFSQKITQPQYSQELKFNN